MSDLEPKRILELCEGLDGRSLNALLMQAFNNSVIPEDLVDNLIKLGLVEVGGTRIENVGVTIRTNAHLFT